MSLYVVPDGTCQEKVRVRFLALAEVTGSVVVDADLVDQLPNELSELTAPEALVEMVDKETERLIKMDAWEYGDCRIYK